MGCGFSRPRWTVRGESAVCLWVGIVCARVCYIAGMLLWILSSLVALVFIVFMQ